jgi:meckelin
VVVPAYWQRVFRLPPELATMRAIFMHDFHSAFAGTIFWGNELRLCVFEALLCCAVDMSQRNIVVAAFVAFVVMRALAWLRACLGERNLSRKTLVDRHFLI